MAFQHSCLQTAIHFTPCRRFHNALAMLIQRTHEPWAQCRASTARPYCSSYSPALIVMRISVQDGGQVAMPSVTDNPAPNYPKDPATSEPKVLARRSCDDGRSVGVSTRHPVEPG